VLLLAAVVGCAGAGFKNQTFQGDITKEEYAHALEQLEAFSDEDVSALLDRGLILQAMGRFEESNAAFEKAERLVADLYTRSLSKEALSLLTSDLALDYRASGFEHAYVAYYRAWNYMELGQRDGVLVEARKINERLTFRSASCEEQGGACGHDVFLRYFSGLLFEWGGELNDAYIAYKQAGAAAATSEELYGTLPPRDLGLRLVHLARRLGFRDQEAEFAGMYGLDPEELRRTPPGNVVVFWENGIVGSREEVTSLIPIFKGETQLIAKDKDGWSRKLADRRYVAYEKVELDYLLRISLPAFVDHPPQAERAQMHLGSHSMTPHSVAPLSVMAAYALDQAMVGIVVRAIGRGLVKYLAKEAADEEIGEGAGVLVNLLGVVLENADTRSWRSLPNRIHMASFALESGKYEGRLRVYGSEERGLIEEADFGTVEIASGDIVFLRHRTVP
jgi:hypothetical protein